MKTRFTPPPRILCVLLLMLMGFNASSQLWTVTGTTTANTNTSGYDVVTGAGFNLGVNTNTTLLPCWSCSGPIKYPFVVYGTQVLWDPLDNYRNLIGISTTGGINFASGQDLSTGSGLTLNAFNSATNPGSVQTTSNWDGTGGSSTQVAFQHNNWNAATSAFMPLFTILKNNNARLGSYGLPTADRLTIDGDLYLNAYNNSIATDRNIFARTPQASLNITSSDFTDGSNGACLTAISYLNVVEPTAPWGIPTPGAFIAKSFAQPVHNSLGIGYAYQNWEAGTPGPGSIHNVFLINGSGQGIFGHDVDLSDIAGGDVFTVKQYMGFWSVNDADTRTIHGNTNTGLLSLNSNNNAINSSSIELYGMGNTTYPGQIHFITTPGRNSVGCYFMNYDPIPGIEEINMVVGNNGQVLVGKNADLPYAVAGDNLSVLDGIGFYQPSTNNWRHIHGNDPSGTLAINSNTAFDDGAGIELYGPTTALFSGEDRSGRDRFIAYGNPTLGRIAQQFSSYNPSTSVVTDNFLIGDNGQSVIGSGVAMSDITGIDALTVRGVMGMYSSTDVPYVRGIHGNSTTGGLFMYSKAAYNDGGSGVELWGGGSANPGDIHFICSGTDASPAFQFNNASPTYHNYMNINKNGTVVIGGPGNDASSLLMPGDYGLYVGGGVLTEHAKVAIHTSMYWSDYVFAKEYQLMPLNKVEQYVQQNSHLPDVPSADEVVKDGVDLGSMDALLLKKIEELTLYVIQQQKQINELQQKLENKKQ